MFDEFFEQYIETLLWSETTEDGSPLDDDFSTDDIGNIEEIKSEVLDFFNSALPAISEAIEKHPHYDISQAGHDYALTRNDHGAGFWDRGLGNIGTTLTDMAKAYGSCNLYVGDDGKLYS
jgi:hypothetical protein